LKYSNSDYQRVYMATSKALSMSLVAVGHVDDMCDGHASTYLNFLNRHMLTHDEDERGSDALQLRFTGLSYRFGYLRHYHVYSSTEK
jgi:hypothetical protein